MASWLSGFAEKAEELLNKVDQSAAAVVTSGDEATPGSSSSRFVPSISGSETLSAGGGGLGVEASSRASSNISSTDYQVEGGHLLGGDVTNDPPSSTSSSSYAIVTSNDTVTPVNSTNNINSTNNKDSSEVIALRNEVQSLNQDLQSVTERARRSRRDLQEAESKLRAYSEQLNASDRRIRELEGQEADHVELLKVRETQLEATRNQVEDLRSNAASEAAELAASDGIVVQRLREELQRSQQKAVSIEEELTSERRHVRELDLQLVQVKGEAESDRESAQSKLADLERRVAQQRTAASEASAQLRHWQTETDRAKQELAEYKEKASRILQSKERLIASLQSSGENGGFSTGAAGSSPAMQVQQLTAELEEIRSERDWLRDELQAARLTVETLKSEQLELESQVTANNETANERAQAAADALQSERRHRIAANAESERWKKAAESAEAEVSRSRNDFENKIARLEQELVQVRAANNRSGSTAGGRGSNSASTAAVGDAELVARLQGLTESLVQKQLVVETVTAEKNSMAAQLARVERQYRDLVESSFSEEGARSTNQSMVRSTSSNVLIAGLNDDPSARLRQTGHGNGDYSRPVMRESAFDSPVARTAKRVVNQLDRFASHTSIVFRRFPLARPFLLVYMTILHLWVTFVLLTYQPEQHNLDLPTGSHTGMILPPMPVDSNAPVPVTPAHLP